MSKRKLSGSKATAAPDVRTHALEETPPEFTAEMSTGRKRSQVSKGELATIRYAAGLYFTTDLNGCTVRDMRQLPQFKMVTMKQLDKWCEQDQWIEQRHANLAKWKGVIEARMGQTFIQQQMQTLEQMQGLLNHGLGMIMPDESGHSRVMPGTWEGVASVMLRIAKETTAWRQTFAKNVADDLPVQKRNPEVMLPKRDNLMTAEAAQQMAHMMLEKRMQAEQHQEAEPEQQQQTLEEVDKS